jgi:hypothetical protein
MVVAAWGLLACLIVPLRFGDRRVYVVEGRDLDATQGCLLTAAGIDRLLTRPFSFYDTAILYPDRTQLRSTEPFLGYAILGLPLRVGLAPGDVELFEMLRWVIVFTSLGYAYLLFKAIGIDVTLALAGAVLCLSQPALLNEIERLQVLCIPLILPVFYHALMIWKSDRLTPIHSAALFLFTALYPLCGAINATVMGLAALVVVPLLAKTLADLRRRKRLTAFLVPIGLAALFDALALAPWLLDRADLKPYVTESFLRVKHWNPTNLPLRLRHVAQFLSERIGWTVTAVAILLLVIETARHLPRNTGRGRSSDRPRHGLKAVPSRGVFDAMHRDSSGEPLKNRHGASSERYLLVLLVPALAMLVTAAYGVNRQNVPSLGLLFDIICIATLLLFLRAQSVVNVAADLERYVTVLSAGVGVFLCVMSFGPVYPSNAHPLATNLMRGLLVVLPPLKSIREYDRIWAFGMLFLSIYITVRLAAALRDAGSLMRGTVATVVIAATMVGLYERKLVASADIEAPADFVQAARTSRRHGAIYVHPMMKWNARSGVLMVDFARRLGRPVVNGCLGICPPWFLYAGAVLHRFPDPEALWLLRTWGVETVVGVTGDVVGNQSKDVEKVFDNGHGLVVWELQPSEGGSWHPSAAVARLSGRVRSEASWSPGERTDAGVAMVRIPEGRRAEGVEVVFEPSIVDRIPTDIDVFAAEGDRRIRLNHDRAGTWIESLGAAALLRRDRPVAMVQFSRPVGGELELVFRNTPKPPIARLALILE